ncbi:hypothetical protein F5882DRAFT_339792, partial [Hyaloscypha sp. PMI_1271]
MSSTIKPYPKQRRSAPKVRTGCGTCRLRRVKCDEGKPVCQRCIKFGVECDGYHLTLRWKREFVPSQPAMKVLSSGSLAKSPFANSEEHQYFDLFCARTGYDIFPTFDSGYTRQRLLESCHFNPAIRHAIVALGALDKTAELVQ